MKSAGNISIEDRFEVIPEKSQNLSADGEEWFWDVNRRHGVPLQYYSVEIKVSGGGQVAKIMLQLHGSRSSGAGLRKSNMQTNKCLGCPEGSSSIWQGIWHQEIPAKAGEAEDGEMEPRFVAQEIITEDKFYGSTLDLFQAYALIQEPGSPELGTEIKFGTDQRQVQM